MKYVTCDGMATVHVDKISSTRRRKLGAKLTPNVQVGTHLQYYTSNRFCMGGDVADTMVASSLLFVSRTARVLGSAPGVEIIVGTTSRWVKVIFKINTKVGNVSVWAVCGVLVLLTASVLVLPMQCTRLSTSAWTQFACRLVAVHCSV